MQWTEKQLEIMRACSRLLAQIPSINLTTLSIASELNASEAMLYRHFPSKNKIIVALIEFSEITLFQGAEDIAVKSDVSSDQEIIANSLLIYAEFFQANPGISRLISGEVIITNSQQIMQRVSNLFEKLESILINQLEKTGSKPTHKLLAVTLIMALEGNLKQWIRSGFKYDLPEQQNKLTAFVLSNFYHSG